METSLSSSFRSQIGATRLKVRREGDRDSIGFRKEAIYRFDQGLFDSLRAAFDGKDRKTLMRLWNSAEHAQ